MCLTLSDGNLYQVITLCLRGPRQLLLSSQLLSIVHYGKTGIWSCPLTGILQCWVTLSIADTILHLTYWNPLWCKYISKIVSTGVLFPSLSSYRWLITGKRIIRRSRSLLRQGEDWNIGGICRGKHSTQLQQNHQCLCLKGDS